jgi:thiamine pyrophosphate-dependent acetolactate synthase large subunit-like protein
MWGDEKVLEAVGGDGCMTLCIQSLNCILKNGLNGAFVFCHNKTYLLIFQNVYIDMENPGVVGSQDQSGRKPR